MKLQCVRLLLILSMLMVMAVWPLTAVASAVNWRTYAEGTAVSRTSGKKMLVNFYADWCQYCVRMKNETYADIHIVDYLNRNFIPVRVEHDREKDLVKRFRVQGLPVTWFVDADGRQIGSYPGFIDAATLLQILKYLHTDSYRSMTFGNFLKTLPQ